MASASPKRWINVKQGSGTCCSLDGRGESWSVLWKKILMENPVKKSNGEEEKQI